MKNPYDDRYHQENYYWGFRPSSTSLKVLTLLPPEKPLRLLDVGCGEGRNAVFFARNGYEVTAFDLSSKGVEKTKMLADKAGVSVNVFEANLLEYRVEESYDIIFSTGAFHYIPPDLRTEIITNYMMHTNHLDVSCYTSFS